MASMHTLTDCLKQIPTESHVTTCFKTKEILYPQLIGQLALINASALNFNKQMFHGTDYCYFPTRYNRFKEVKSAESGTMGKQLHTKGQCSLPSALAVTFHKQVAIHTLACSPMIPPT